MVNLSSLWNRVCREIPEPIPCQLIPQGRGKWIFQAGPLSWGPGKPEEIIPLGIKEGAKRGWPSFAHLSSPPPPLLPNKTEQDRTKESREEPAPPCPSKRSAVQVQGGARSDKAVQAPRKKDPSFSQEEAPFVNVWARPKKSKREDAPPWDEPAPRSSRKLPPAPPQKSAAVTAGGAATPKKKQLPKKGKKMGGWIPLF